MAGAVKRFSVFVALAFAALSLSAQPAGYYNSAAGLTGNSLRSALHNIIDNHNSVSYGSLWTYFESTDKRPNGKVWDMYSNCQFVFGDDQCGTYDSECDCYNREHSWPKSWFNDMSPMYTDLFHLYPTDGYVNGKRGNLPFGEVGTVTWTSANGSKLGYCSYPGYSGIVFEPADEYKGDFARTYFYMCTRYYGEDAGWEETDMTNGANLKPWALAMLLEWNQNDPVSQKEIARNNAVYQIQGNRNPFIDNPEYAQMIWDPTWTANYVIEASAGAGGTIQPSGSVSVAYGGSKTFTVTANQWYQIANVVVDGASHGAVSSYTFSNVSANHTISATFVEKGICLPPQSITAEVSANTVYLTWSEVGTATDYEVYRDGSHVGMVSQTSFTDHNLTLGQHCYKIMTYCLDGFSGFSNDKCVQVDHIGVTDNDRVECGVYPNPVGSGEQLRVVAEKPIVGEVMVCDLSGRVVFRLAVDGANEVSLALPRSLEAGFYVVSVPFEGGTTKGCKLFAN